VTARDTPNGTPLVFENPAGINPSQYHPCEGLFRLENPVDNARLKSFALKSRALRFEIKTLELVL